VWHDPCRTSNLLFFSPMVAASDHGECRGCWLKSRQWGYRKSSYGTQRTYSSRSPITTLTSVEALTFFPFRILRIVLRSRPACCLPRSTRRFLRLRLSFSVERGRRTDTADIAVRQANISAYATQTGRRGLCVPSFMKSFALLSLLWHCVSRVAGASLRIGLILESQKHLQSTPHGWRLPFARSLRSLKASMRKGSSTCSCHRAVRKTILSAFAPRSAV
jgi:hypothetical protein